MSFFPPLSKKVKFLTLLTAFLSAISIFSFVYADNYQWTFISNSSNASDWVSIAVSSDATHVYAVRNADYIYKSDDFGASWQQISSVGPYNWRSIKTSSSGANAIAVANGGQPWVTNNYGGSWTPFAGVGLWSAAAMSPDGGAIYIADQTGAVFKTTNNGPDLASSMNAGSEVSEISYSPDGNKTVLSTLGNGVYYIDFEGWHNSNVGDQNISSVAVSNGGTYVAAATDGYVYLSTSPETNVWNRVNSLGIKYWKSVSISADGNTIAAAAYDDSIFTSTDGGTTWNEESIAGVKAWNGVALSYDGTLILAASSNSYLAKANLVSGNDFYYNDSNGNHDWGTVANWWKDSSFTVPAGKLPDSNSDVFIKANVIDNSDALPHVKNLDISNDSFVGTPVTVTENTIIHDTSSLSSTLTGNAYFYDSSSNGGTVNGNAEFFNHSQNGSTVNGNAVFHDSSVNANQVTGTAVFNDSAHNNDGAEVHDDATFNGSAENFGTLGNNAIFNDSSILVAGGALGNATFYGDVSDIQPSQVYGTPSITGTKIRRYTADITTSRDFTAYGSNWTVIADGAVVDITNATHDSSTIFTTLNGGSFYDANQMPQDSTRPTVGNISSASSDGTYKAGDSINIGVGFSENVTSTGGVTVTLDTGGSCSFDVTNGAAGTCNYIVRPGDNSSRLTVTSIVGTIVDQSSNAMTDFTPLSNLNQNKNIIVDTTAPTISITSPTSGTTNSFTPSVSWGDSSTCQYKFDGGSYQSAVCASNGSDIPTPPDGSHTLMIRGTDTVGNSATSSVSFTYTTPTQDNGMGGGNDNGNNESTTTVPRPPSSSSGNSNSSISITLPNNSVVNAPAYVVKSIVTKLQSILQSLLRLVQNKNVPTGESNSSTMSSPDETNASPTAPLPAPVATTTEQVMFTHTLTLKDSGPDVKKLQEYLNSHGFVIAKSGPGSPGNETDKFGIGTFTTLIKFQRSVGISGSGFFGSTTLDYVNSHQ